MERPDHIQDSTTPLAPFGSLQLWHDFISDMLSCEWASTELKGGGLDQSKSARENEKGDFDASLHHDTSFHHWSQTIYLFFLWEGGSVWGKNWRDRTFSVWLILRIDLADSDLKGAISSILVCEGGRITPRYYLIPPPPSVYHPQYKLDPIQATSTASRAS